MATDDREEELEALDGLAEIDVTDCAEDNEQLNSKFEQVVRHPSPT